MNLSTDDIGVSNTLDAGTVTNNDAAVGIDTNTGTGLGPGRRVAPEARRVRSGRRHAARKSRVAALGLSVATTGLLSVGFARADHADAATSTVATVQKFTGAPSTNRWGTVIVQITVKNGVIIDDQATQLPTSHAKSVRLSTNAAQVLRTKVLTAKSANVDIVSGATMTSRSYLNSLQSAIDQARAAGALS